MANQNCKQQRNKPIIPVQSTLVINDSGYEFDITETKIDTNHTNEGERMMAIDDEDEQQPLIISRSKLIDIPLNHNFDFDDIKEAK